MNIASLSSTGGVQLQRQQAPPPPPPMTNTAKLLGMSTDELRQAQASGTTLTDLATQKGISKDDLVKSVAADLKANKPDGAPELSDVQLTEMATNIAEGKRPERPGHHHGGHRVQSEQSRATLAAETGTGLQVDYFA